MEYLEDQEVPWWARQEERGTRAALHRLLDQATPAAQREKMKEEKNKPREVREVLSMARPPSQRGRRLPASRPLPELQADREDLKQFCHSFFAS